MSSGCLCSLLDLFEGTSGSWHPGLECGSKGSKMFYQPGMSRMKWELGRLKTFALLGVRLYKCKHAGAQRHMEDIVLAAESDASEASVPFSCDIKTAVKVTGPMIKAMLPFCLNLRCCCKIGQHLQGNIWRKCRLESDGLCGTPTQTKAHLHSTSGLYKVDAQTLFKALGKTAKHVHKRFLVLYIQIIVFFYLCLGICFCLTSPKWVFNCYFWGE